MRSKNNQYHFYFLKGCQGITKEPASRGSRLYDHWCIRMSVLIVGIALIGFLSRPVMAAEQMDPEADRILSSMSSYMGNLSAFTTKADVDNEIIDLNGQKLQFGSSADIVVNRPGNFYISRQGAIADYKLIYNGKTMTLYSRNLNVYFKQAITGTIDSVIDTLHNEIGFSAPGAELFYTNNYERLSEGVVSSAYLGTSYVNGVECHYLTFREAQVDWQIWIKAEGDPQPMKFVITTKWMTGAPQYAVRFTEWNTSPKIKPDNFEFKVPKGARKVEALHADEMGELVIEEVEK